MLNPLIRPEHFSAQILPKEYKERVEKHYLKFMNQYLSGYPGEYKKYESLLNFVWEKDLTEHLPQFVKWMKRLDEYRGEILFRFFQN